MKDRWRRAVLTVESVVWMALLLPLVVGGCDMDGPLALEGRSCRSAPCVAGLVCVQEVCVQPEPTLVSGCDTDDDCVWKGSSDGRACEEGVCVFAACAFDVQCGRRICDDGRCAELDVCLDNSDCGAPRRCREGVCRSPCAADADCPVFGGFLQTCVDGDCLQRCFGDVTCFGRICEENLCVEPACTDDAACSDQGSFFCDAGRCVQFTPCALDADCFDPDYRCNALGRCEERPACRVDGECDAGLCINRHCRDADRCTEDAGCAGSRECIAGRCVDAPACRSSMACSAGEMCHVGRCVPRALGDVARVEGEVAAQVAFVGHAVAAVAQAYADDGLPVVADYRWSGAVGTGPRATVLCEAPGPVSLGVEVRGRAGAAQVVDLGTVACVAPAGALSVLVVDGRDGSPVPGATVWAEDVEAGVTNVAGALFLEGFEGGAVGARSVDGRGVVVIDAAPGRLYLALPALPALPALAAPDTGDVAGVRVRVQGDGGESEPVGISLALPAVPHARAATLEAIFGPPFPAAVDVPLLGALAFELPAGVMLDATLPLLGLQEVKEVAFVEMPPGPAQVLAYEARYPQGALLELAVGADPLEVVLDLAAGAEGMDAALVGAGVLAAIPRVQDGDLTDGVEDVDGDGDLAERVPDWFAFRELEVVPVTPPTERVGLVVSRPPQASDLRMFAVCGVELPARFMPLGVTAVFGLAQSAASSEQIKVLAAPASLAGQERACAIHAVSRDGASSSVALARAAAFGARVAAGGLLAPPSGAFVLEGTSASERASVVVPVVPAADAISLELLGVDGTAWRVVSTARDSVALPGWIVPVGVAEVSALRLSLPVAEVVAGGPWRALEDMAEAVATAR